MNKKKLISELKDQGIKELILEAIDKIDRINFINPELKTQAYENYPLPIGFNQTISQPYTVAFMLQELELKKGDRVLEIGTGSGWNAALISFLIGEKGKLYTLENIKELSEQAKKRLANYNNVKVINKNGKNGYKKEAKYDKIILTASPKEINNEFKEQLKNKGILITPVGKGIQNMIKIRKVNEMFIKENLGEFKFVPLT